MSDLISRQALINKAEYEAEAMAEPFKSQLPVLVAWLAEKIPSAEPQRKKGKWLMNGERYGHMYWRCSQCGEEVDYIGANYCPNCRCQMEGEE